MKELKIGEEIRIRCVENEKGIYICKSCVFCDNDKICDAIDCVTRNVHFELVED